MSKSYTDIVKQIEALQVEAARLKSAEISGVIVRIKEAIAAYGLSASDLGLGAKPGRKPGRPVGSGKKKPGPKPGAKKAAAAASPFGTASKPGKPSKSSKAARFRDTNGNTWVGRGPRPQWLRDALAAGKSLKDFAV